MKRLLLPLIAMAVSMSVAAQTQWLDLTSGSIVSELIGTDSGYDTKFDGNTLTVTFSLTAVTLNECPEYPGTYTLNIDGFADNHTLGEPALPYIHDIFNIGASSDCSVELLSATYRDYDIAVAPAYGDVYHYEQQKPIQPITATDLATEPIVKEAVMPINQSYLVDIKVNPVLYLSPTRVRVYDTIKYRITSDDTISNDLMAETKRYVDFGSPNIGDNSGIMPMSYRPLEPKGKNKIYCENYVIITTPKFKSCLTEFINWKKTLGFNVSVLCSPGEVWQSYDEVKAAVNTTHRLKGGVDYLLIVGDGKNVPPFAYKGLHSTIIKDSNNNPIDTIVHNVHTDIKFASADIGQLPSTCYGRLPVKNSDEAKTVLDKIMRYESTPPAEESFYNRGIHVSSLQEWLFGEQIEVSEVCLANNLQAGLDIERRYFRSSDLYSKPIVGSGASKFEYGVKIEDFLKDPNYYEKVVSWYDRILTDQEIQQSSINAAINKGALYVGYFGHGENNRWGHPNYTAAHIRALTNNTLQPVVFSITCRTGRYIFEKEETFASGWANNETCFAYEFLVKKNGGCVGIFAATDNLWSGKARLVNYAMFRALWPNNILTDEIRPTPLTFKPVLKSVHRLG